MGDTQWEQEVVRFIDKLHEQINTLCAFVTRFMNADAIVDLLIEHPENRDSERYIRLARHVQQLKQQCLLISPRNLEKEPTSSLRNMAFVAHRAHAILRLYNDDSEHFPLTQDRFEGVVGTSLRDIGWHANQYLLRYPDSHLQTQLQTIIRQVDEYRRVFFPQQMVTYNHSPRQNTYNDSINERKSVSLASLLLTLSLISPYLGRIRIHGINAQNKHRLLDYYPHATTQLLRHAMFHVSISQNSSLGQLLFAVHSEENFVRLSITNPDYAIPMTDWELLMFYIGGEKNYEHLRELGGRVEPLTWGQGFGQGIILRLPWAR